jgi:hypothetical protein
MPNITMSEEVKELISHLQLLYSNIPSSSTAVVIRREEELANFKDGKKDKKNNPTIYRKNAFAILNWLVFNFPAIVAEILQNYDENDGIKAGKAVYSRFDTNIKAAMNYLGDDCTPPKSINCIDAALYQQYQYLSWFLESVKIVMTPPDTGMITNFAVKFGFNNYIKSFNAMLAFYEKEKKLPHKDYKVLNDEILALIKNFKVVKTDAAKSSNNPNALFSPRSSSSASNDDKVSQDESKRKSLN